MFKKYLWCLFKQFCDAKGLDVTNANKMYSDDFVDWVVQNKFLLGNYMDYLHALGFDYLADDIVEVGKGQYDSISQHGISLVSPFAETTGRINSRLFVDKGIPLILQQNEIVIPREHIILTHNPYFESEILRWYSIHNFGENNISIGMFGKLEDEDTSRKVRLLEQLSKQMTDDYSFDYDTSDGNYFCSLNSKRNIKRKVLIKTRDIIKRKI